VRLLITSAIPIAALCLTYYFLLQWQLPKHLRLSIFMLHKDTELYLMMTNVHASYLVFWTIK